MDISLSDVAWVMGSLLVFVACRMAWEYRAGIARAVSSVSARYVARPSGVSTEVAGASTGASEAVLGQQHHLAPAPVLDFAAVLDYLKRHNLSDDEAIDLLTLVHRESGDLFSANKICDIVGGNDGRIKARVASHRPKPPAPKSPARIERPAKGW